MGESDRSVRGDSTGGPAPNILGRVQTPDFADFRGLLPNPPTTLRTPPARRGKGEGGAEASVRGEPRRPSSKGRRVSHRAEAQLQEGTRHDGGHRRGLSAAGSRGRGRDGPGLVPGVRQADAGRALLLPRVPLARVAGAPRRRRPPPHARDPRVRSHGRPRHPAAHPAPRPRGQLQRLCRRRGRAPPDGRRGRAHQPAPHHLLRRPAARPPLGAAEPPAAAVPAEHLLHPPLAALAPPAPRGPPAPGHPRPHPALAPPGNGIRAPAPPPPALRRHPRARRLPALPVPRAGPPRDPREHAAEPAAVQAPPARRVAGMDPRRREPVRRARARRVGARAAHARVARHHAADPRARRGRRPRGRLGFRRGRGAGGGAGGRQARRPRGRRGQGDRGAAEPAAAGREVVTRERGVGGAAVPIVRDTLLVRRPLRGGL